MDTPNIIDFDAGELAYIFIFGKYRAGHVYCVSLRGVV